jgi:hypothetical protein
MTLRLNGVFRCDRCGTDLVSDSITECAHITQLNPNDPGDIQHFHLCNDCRVLVLTADTLPSFYEES